MFLCPLLRAVRGGKEVCVKLPIGNAIVHAVLKPIALIDCVISNVGWVQDIELN
jgi:hypothetical protein